MGAGMLELDDQNYYLFCKTLNFQILTLILKII